jgi:hypothetical protein
MSNDIEDAEDESKSPPMTSSHGAPNYKIMGSQAKPETRIDFEKIPETKEIIFEILKKDREYWQNLKKPTQGIEKFNLLNKVCNKLPINSNVFEIALDELMGDQLVVPMELDNKIRFILLCLQKDLI